MNEFRRVLIKVLFFSSLILFPLLEGKAQPLSPEDTKALRFIIDQPQPIAEVSIYHSSYRRLPAIYLPEDLGIARPDGVVVDHILKNSNGTFMVIEGTGRVYRLIGNEQHRVSFERLDSTRFFGYNYGALVYTFRDSIFSLGGYGHWQHNGQLRYFDPSIHGWKMLPTNRKVEARQLETGYHLDEQNAELWYINPSNRLEGIKAEDVTEQMREAGKVFRLNLDSKDWVLEGMVTDEFNQLFAGLHQISETDRGTLVLNGGAKEISFDLISYRDNRLYRLVDQLLVNNIHSAVIDEQSGSDVGRPLAWFAGDSLHIFKTGAGHMTFHLDSTKFMNTGIKIYTPQEQGSSWTLNENWKVVLLLSFGLLAGTVSGYGIFRKRHLSPDTTEPEYFSVMERNVLLAMDAAPGHSLSVEEMDEWLGTDRKSKDVQNQKRSAVTRSINRAYQALTGDPENLIETRRQEFDRRMIRYELNQSKFAAVRDQVRQAE